MDYSKKMKVVRSEEKWVKDNWKEKAKVTPIFIITYDRLKVLKQSIDSYCDNIETPFEVVIIDFGSTYEPTRNFLRHLEFEGKKVYWKEKFAHRFRFNSHINEVVQNYFNTHPKSNYVVTDPDIVLDNVRGDVLEVYAHLLDNLPKIDVVGPMLRIDDIPDCYPRKKELITDSQEMKHHSSPVHIIQYKRKPVKYIFSRIDTTFGLHRAENNFNRKRPAARVFSPYSARHLDWYLDPENLTSDQKYYMEHASMGITNWSRW